MTPDAPEGTVTSELHALTQPDPRTISWEHKLWRRRAEQLWPQRLQNITVIHRRVPHDGKRPAPRHRRCRSDACMRTYLRTFACVRMHACIHTHMHAYIHTYMHAYTRCTPKEDLHCLRSCMLQRPPVRQRDIVLSRRGILSKNSRLSLVHCATCCNVRQRDIVRSPPAHTCIDALASAMLLMPLRVCH